MRGGAGVGEAVMDLFNPLLPIFKSRDHRDKIEVPYPLAVDDLISSHKIINEEKLQGR